MINKLIGILLLFLGLKVLLLQDFSGQWSDYSFSNNYLFVPLSLLLFYISYLFIRYNPKEIDEKFSKCKKCKKCYNYIELKKCICPKCNIETIEIEDYYKKYPDELKDV